MLAEEPSSEQRGEWSLGEERYGCDGGREMAQRVRESEVAAELRDEAKADECEELAMIRDVERYAQKKIDHEEEDRSRDRCETQEYERAGVDSNTFGGEKIDGETCRSGQRHEVAGAEVEMTRQVGPDNDE